MSRIFQKKGVGISKRLLSIVFPHILLYCKERTHACDIWVTVNKALSLAKLVEAILDFLIEIIFSEQGDGWRWNLSNTV